MGLQKGEIELSAVWKPVRQEPLDDVLHEVAAYELDKILQLDMVPPSVERVIEGQKGALQLFNYRNVAQEIESMAERNFSMVDYFNRRAEDWRPALSFDGPGNGERMGNPATDWVRWQAEASRKLTQLLGEFPEPVEMNAEVVYSVLQNGLVRERVVFDSEAGMSVPCTLLKLPEVPSDDSAPAILCCHGHGPFGKEPVTGNASSDGLRASIAFHNYNYA